MTKNQIMNFLDRYGLLILCLIWLVNAFTWANRIMFGDEAMMGVAILKSGLSPFEPLTKYDQATTYGLHVLTVLTTSIFGYSNIAMRLPSLLIFFVVLVIWANFLKQQYGGLTGFTVTIIMLLNTSLIRYATEFKHYGFEVAFTMLLLVTYMQYRKSKTSKNLIIHVSVAIVAIFFGLSTLLVATSIFIVESVSYLRERLEHETRNKALITLIKSDWIRGHLVYYSIFLFWYIFSIRPATIYQTLNYIPDQPSVEQILSIPYWLHSLNMIGIGVFGFGINLPFLIALFGIIYLIVVKRHENRAFLIFVVLYGLMYMLNIIGMYPIWWMRHLLYIVPIIYLIFAELFYLITPRKLMATAISAVIVSSVFIGYIVFHRYNEVWDFQLPADLALIEPTDTVFVHHIGQPVYDWYQLSHDPNLPNLAKPVIGRESGLIVPVDDLISDFEGNMSRPGAWASAIELTNIYFSPVYDDYFVEQVTSVEKSKIFHYWTMPSYLIDMISEHCTITPMTDSWRVWVAEVECDVDSNLN